MTPVDFIILWIPFATTAELTVSQVLVIEFVLRPNVQLTGFPGGVS